ncbi:MAG: hypothetical protein ABSG15_04680 [FCB group bacterium]
MKQKLFFLAFIFSFFCLNAFLFAQTDSTKNLVDDDDYWFVFDNKENQKGMTISMKTYFENPTIDLDYGFGSPSMYKNVFTGNFANINSGEIDLGFTNTRLKKYEKGNVLKYYFSYVFLSNLTSDLRSKSDSGIKTNTWRFGFSSRDGYGYQLGENSNIVLYRSKGFSWTKFDFKDTLANAYGNHIVDTYGETFRFGETFQAGIKVKLFSPLSLGAGYERTIITPRFLFWSWLGSTAIFEIGDGILSHFSRQIIKASPAAGPIVNFFLMNAYSYGIYELQKKNMNWPFRTAPPLMYDNFKVGLNFEF